MISLNNEITVWKEELSDFDLYSLKSNFLYVENKYAIVISIRNVTELSKLGRILTEMEKND